MKLENLLNVMSFSQDMAIYCDGALVFHTNKKPLLMDIKAVRDNEVIHVAAIDDTVMIEVRKDKHYGI